jgi:hypothetical protein
LDLLDRLIAMIRRDAEEHGDAALTVTLDYVDRGSESRGVLDTRKGPGHGKCPGSPTRK